MNFSTRKPIVPQNSSECILDRVDMHIVNISTRVDNDSFNHVDCPSISGGLRSDLIHANNCWPQRPADLPESPSNGKPLDPAAITPLMQRSASVFRRFVGICSAHSLRGLRRLTHPQLIRNQTFRSPRILTRILLVSLTASHYRSRSHNLLACLPLPTFSRFSGPADAYIAAPNDAKGHVTRNVDSRHKIRPSNYRHATK